MNMTGLNVRKIPNKLFIENLHILWKIISVTSGKRTLYVQGYFSSYPNDLAICTLEEFNQLNQWIFYKVFCS